MMPARRAAVVLSLLLVPLSLLAAGQPGREATALKISEPIKVDGVLDEAAWDRAPVLTDFIQFQPERGAPASVRTAVRVLYDGTAVYFGFENTDPDLGQIAARITKRDADLKEDDAVAVYIDTYADRRACYYFMTNLLGTQSDGRITDNGLTTDATWDGVWRSAARQTETGWTAEIAVELASLKYKPGRGRVWGLGLARLFPRRLEHPPGSPSSGSSPAWTSSGPPGNSRSSPTSWASSRSGTRSGRTPAWTPATRSPRRSPAT